MVDTYLSDLIITGVDIQVESESQLKKLQNEYPDSVDLGPVADLDSDSLYPLVIEGHFSDSGVFLIYAVFSEGTEYHQTFEEFYADFDEALEQFE